MEKKLTKEEIIKIIKECFLSEEVSVNSVNDYINSVLKKFNENKIKTELKSGSYILIPFIDKSNIKIFFKREVDTVIMFIGGTEKKFKKIDNLFNHVLENYKDKGFIKIMEEGKKIKNFELKEMIKKVLKENYSSKLPKDELLQIQSKFPERFKIIDLKKAPLSGYIGKVKIDGTEYDLDVLDNFGENNYFIHDYPGENSMEYLEGFGYKGNIEDIEFDIFEDIKNKKFEDFKDLWNLSKSKEGGESIKKLENKIKEMFGSYIPIHIEKALQIKNFENYIRWLKKFNEI